MSFFLRGKVAIVTGSSNGIGRATAVLLSQKEVNVVITGRNQMALEETKKQCKNAEVLAGDITKKDFQSKLVDFTLQKFGQLDILVNNAGALYVDETGKEGFEQPINIFEKNLDINLKSVLALTQLSYSHLVNSKGSIVNVSSILSLPPHGSIAMPYYAICKAALDHMSRSMALEYIKKGVRVNTVNPGLIRTAFFEKLGMETDKVKKMEDHAGANPAWIPLGRAGKSEEVAKLITFLADRSQSEYIVGQCFPICGGSSLVMAIDNFDFKEYIG